MKLRLRFQSKAGGNPKTFEVRLPLVIGRGEQASFRIPHVRISWRHCELLEEEGSVFVRDLGSTNGTMLRGTMLPSRTKTRVPPGSLLSLGGLAFHVDYEGPVEDLLPMAEGEAIDFLEAEPESELLEPVAEAEPLESLVELEPDDAAELEAEPLAELSADDFFLEPDEGLPAAQPGGAEDSLLELEPDGPADAADSDDDIALDDFLNDV